tara:strand:- start:27 stop:350 length:324 start_codon:yes stop_codon:yes gene_type:complete
MNKLTAKEILSEVFKYDGANDEAINTILGLFESSNQSLEDFILEMDNAEHWNTGGGCMVSVIELDTKELFIVSDECAIIYKDADSFWEYDEDSEVMGWWIKLDKENK